MPRFQPHGNVNSINKSWCGAQGKGPTMDLVFYVSAIKIYANGLCASQAQYVLRHLVKMQIIKNTTASYAPQR